ncbi:hypothetical protein DENSPDRAFT_875612 [Dentipellis sp. KUC8613]|nr:hypothetical protein DENSPDRAFT_875612 [Dentipellis sp. KUC8613]
MPTSELPANSANEHSRRRVGGHDNAQQSGSRTQSISMSSSADENYTSPPPIGDSDYAGRVQHLAPQPSGGIPAQESFSHTASRPNNHRYNERASIPCDSSQYPRRPTQRIDDSYPDPMMISLAQDNRYDGRADMQHMSQQMSSHLQAGNPAQQSSMTPTARSGIVTPTGQYPRRDEYPREQIPAMPQHGRTYDQDVPGHQSSTMNQHQQAHRNRRADYNYRAQESAATQHGRSVTQASAPSAQPYRNHQADYDRHAHGSTAAQRGGSAFQTPTIPAQPYRGQNPHQAQTSDNRNAPAGYVTTTYPTGTGAHYAGCTRNPCTCRDQAWHNARDERVARRRDPRDSMYPHPSSSRDDLAASLYADVRVQNNPKRRYK